MVFSLLKVKGLMINVLDCSISLLSAALYRLLGESHSNHELATYRPLTPIIRDKGDISEYAAPLLNVLEGKMCKQVSNIAITGGYAVGKSTFLRSFMHHYPQYRKTPIISMAKYEGEDRLAESIEKSILEQLLYSQSANNLPLSRYKRIREATWWWRWAYPVGLFVLIISFFRLYTPSKSYIKSKLPFLAEWGGAWPNWLALFVGIVITFWLLRAALIKLHGFSLNKLSAKGAELERMSQRSFLHENIDEIVYFFQKSKAYPHVVIFEDIDRLDSSQATSVLTHIREVNRLVNGALNEPVYFIYAVRDELFSATNRTKFFDVIIPIVPVINSNNAYEKLKEALGSESEDISGDLLENCSYFFDDLRQIISLSNEYKLYKSLLFNGHKLEHNCLFALLAVKTLNPKSYSDLALGSGELCEVLHSAPQAKDELQKSLKREQKEILKAKQAKSELVLKQREDYLRLFWAYCEEKTNHNALANFDGPDGYEQYNAAIKPGSKFESALLHSDEHQHHFQHPRFGGHNIDSIQEITNSDGLTYKNMFNLLSKKISEFDDDYKAIQQQIDDIRYQSLSSLLKNASVREYVFNSKASITKLERLLVSRGYIREDYYEYMSFFYEGALTQDDRNKVQQIKAGETLSTDTVFNNPEAVVKKLMVSDFGHGNGLLPQLINTLLDSGNEDKLVAALKDPHDIRTLLRYVWIATDLAFRAKLIKFLFQQRPNMSVNLFVDLMMKSEFVEDVARGYLIDLLHHADQELLSKQRQTLEFQQAVSELGSLSGVSCSEKFEWFWLLRDVKYYQLEEVDKNQALRIVKSGQFQPILLMLRRLLGALGKVSDGEAVTFQALLSIPSFVPLIKKGPHKYLQALSQQPDWCEPKTGSIQAFECMETIEECVTIAKRTQAKYSENETPAGCLTRFIEEDLLVPEWSSILTAKRRLVENADDEPPSSIALPAFIERHIASLSQSSAPDVDSSDYNELAIYLYTAGIDTTTFVQVMESFTASTNLLTILETELEGEHERWTLIAESSALAFSVDNLNLLEQISADAAFRFIKSHWPESKKVILNSEELEVSNQLLIMVIGNKDFPIAARMELLNYFYDVDFSEDTSTAVDIMSEVLRENIMPPVLESSLAIVAIPLLSLSDRAELGLAYLNQSNSYPEVCEVIRECKLNEFEKLHSGKGKLDVVDSETNAKILEKLEELGLVGKAKSKGNQLIAYIHPSNC